MRCVDLAIFFLPDNVIGQVAEMLASQIMVPTPVGEPRDEDGRAVALDELKRCASGLDHKLAASLRAGERTAFTSYMMYMNALTNVLGLKTQAY